MKVTALQTPIIQPNDNLLEVLDASITSLDENSIVVVTSKVVALAEGAVVPKKTGEREEKQAIAVQEADLYSDPTSSKYGIILTIKDQILAVNGGVDESNVEGQYVLLPSDSYRAAEEIWQFLRKKFGLKNLGVIISDSRSIPLKWGVVGTCLAHCGFMALNDHVGDSDLFGYEIQMTQVNVAEAVAISAVFCMGETNEAQPVAVVTEMGEKVVFQDRPPNEQELKDLFIDLEDDVYAPLLQNVDWKIGGAR